MLTIDVEHCTGCRACEQICPKNCIDMQSDKDGFLYPQIHTDACVNCRLCEKICPIGQDIRQDLPTPRVFAAYLRDQKRLQKSASGGMFPALAESILRQGGTVYGCAWNADMKAEAIRIDSFKQMERIQGSKYVESDTGHTFSQVKKDLKEGRTVLYTGTPCQIAGLCSFLRDQNTAKLLTADLICHGVPSITFFQDYLRTLHGKSVVDFQFRDKTTQGWGFQIQYRYQKGGCCRTVRKPDSLSAYYHFFLKGMPYRKSCYTCKYANCTRPGDFTIGDFWGIQNFYPDVPTKQGVSVLLLNSQKAQDYFEKIKESLIFWESDLQKVTASNGQLLSPTRLTAQRDQLLNIWHKSGFKGVYHMFDKEVGKKRYLKYMAKKVLTPKVRKRLKSLLQK